MRTAFGRRSSHTPITEANIGTATIAEVDAPNAKHHHIHAIAEIASAPAINGRGVSDCPGKVTVAEIGASDVESYEQC